MSFETFKQCLDVINQTHNLCQVAFGVGDIWANKDLWKMMEYCRENDIVPNITVNGNCYKKDFDNIAKYCGAVAVSHYDDDLCFNAVKEFTDRGMTQVNIHKLLADETIDECFDLVNKVTSDKRLAKMYAVVFLTLKPIGDRNTMSPPKDFERYKELIDYCNEKGISYGFDSCGSLPYLKALEGTQLYDKAVQYIEPCESYMFSLYVNVDGIAYPCSFLESDPAYNGIYLPTVSNFLKDVWYSQEAVDFRSTLLKTVENNELGCRECPKYKLYDMCR